MLKQSPKLRKLRSEIDRIDDNIHDLLIERAHVAGKVRKTKDKSNPMYRPDREADILYRLMARHHGTYPKQVILRIWREIITATLMLEGPFSVSIFPYNLIEVAKHHFGQTVPLIKHSSISSVIDDIVAGNTTIGIIPFPSIKDEYPYFHGLLQAGTQRPKVVGRLPFFKNKSATDCTLDALVISSTHPGITDHARTQILLITDKGAKRTRITLALTKNDLTLTEIINWQGYGVNQELYFVELDGYISEEDNHLKSVLKQLSGVIRTFIWLGAYPLPLEE